MQRKTKWLLQIALLGFIFLFSIQTYMPFITFLDQHFYYAMSFYMFLFGIILGLVYHTFGWIEAAYAKRQKKNPYFAYLLKILQPSFLISSFLWYAYLYLNKILSDNKTDADYFQTIMVGFSIFFLTIKIGKELATLKKAFLEN